MAAAKLFDALLPHDHNNIFFCGFVSVLAAVLLLCIILMIFKIINTTFHSIANTKIILRINPKAFEII